jgi:hypothetical protein
MTGRTQRVRSTELASLDLSLRLNRLLDNGVLEHPDVRSIAKAIVSQGLSALASEEWYLYTRYILPYLRDKSSSDGIEDMGEAELNEDQCSVRQLHGRTKRVRL